MDRWKSTGIYAKVNKILDVIGILIIAALIIMTFIYWEKLRILYQLILILMVK